MFCANYAQLIKSLSIIYLWFNLLDDISEWSRYTRAEGYSKVLGFCKIDINRFNFDNVIIHFTFKDYSKENKNSKNNRNNEIYEPFVGKTFEYLVKKYYQILYHELEINIKFIVSDQDKEIDYIFERRKGESTPILKISSIQVNSDKILNSIIKKNGLKKLMNNALPS